MPHFQTHDLFDISARVAALSHANVLNNLVSAANLLRRPRDPSSIVCRSIVHVLV